MYSREKLTIKGRASRRVFPSKNALRTKRPVFYSPGEFTGRGSDAHLHKRKVEILRFRAKTQVELKFTPKTKKPTRRPVGGESKKWSEHRDSNPGLSGPKPDALPDCAMLRNHVVNISAEPRISSALCKFHSAGETDREWKNFPSRYSMTEYAPKRVSDPQDVSPRPLESRSKNGV